MVEHGGEAADGVLQLAHAERVGLEGAARRDGHGEPEHQGRGDDDDGAGDDDEGQRLQRRAGGLGEGGRGQERGECRGSC